MTLRKLPEIKALDGLSGLHFEPTDAVLAKWNPCIRAAGETDVSISIFDVIGDDFDGGVTSKRVAAALRSIGNREVTVNVNSPGGDFFEGIAIYNLLREHPARVNVKVLGLAASAASVIAMAGDEIRISEVGFMMIHNAWAMAMGNRHDMRAAADMLEPFDAAMASLYARRSGKDVGDVASLMDAETWMNGEQAVDAGLADGLLPSGDIDASAKAQMKNVAAVRRVEAALAKQGMSRDERRSLIGEIGRPAVADDNHPAVAGEVLAGIARLRAAFAG